MERRGKVSASEIGPTDAATSTGLHFMRDGQSPMSGPQPRTLDGTPETASLSKTEHRTCLTGHAVSPTPRPLFAKIEDAQIAELQRRFAGKP